MNEEQNEDLEKEARELTPEKVQRKLLKLVQESRTFEDFKARLAGHLNWYLGSPMPEPYRRWTWAEFQQFYLDYKK